MTSSCTATARTTACASSISARTAATVSSLPTTRSKTGTEEDRGSGPLFAGLYRNSKNISLTPEGKKLYNYIEEAHNILINGEKMLLDSSSLITGELAIGAPTHIAGFYLLDVIQKFKNSYPNIKIKLYSRSTREMVEMLNDNVLDLIVDNLPIDNEKNKFEIIKLTTVNSCFAYSPNYSSVNKQSITNEDRFILPNEYTVTRKAVNKYLKKYNINVNCNYEVSTTEITLQMVLRGMGIGYFLEPSIKEELKNGTLIKLNNYTNLPTIELGYAYNNTFLSAPAQKFVEMLKGN